jgi:hypothetical protein
MSRYVFLNSEAQDVKVLAAARKAARSRGATVVKSLAGTMLLGPPAQVTEVAQALPGWRYSVERKTTTVPERKLWSAPRHGARRRLSPRDRPGLEADRRRGRIHHAAADKAHVSFGP